MRSCKEYAALQVRRGFLTGKGEEGSLTKEWRTSTRDSPTLFIDIVALSASLTHAFSFPWWGPLVSLIHSFPCQPFLHPSHCSCLPLFSSASCEPSLSSFWGATFLGVVNNLLLTPISQSWVFNHHQFPLIKLLCVHDDDDYMKMMCCLLYLLFAFFLDDLDDLDEARHSCNEHTMQTCPWWDQLFSSCYSCYSYHSCHSSYSCLATFSFCCLSPLQPRNLSTHTVNLTNSGSLDDALERVCWKHWWWSITGRENE